MRVSDKCKKHYVAHLTLICVDFRAYPSARLLICHSPNCLFFRYLTLSSPSSPHPNLIPSPVSPPPSLPLCECCCFPLLCGYEQRSPREAEERMYPRGLSGVLLSVDQHAPDGLTGSSMHSEALTGALGPWSI